MVVVQVTHKEYGLPVIKKNMEDQSKADMTKALFMGAALAFIWYVPDDDMMGRHIMPALCASGPLEFTVTVGNDNIMYMPSLAQLLGAFGIFEFDETMLKLTTVRGRGYGVFMR